MAFRYWTLQPEYLFTRSPVIPVIVLQKLEHALPLAKALIAGGLNVLEITLRTEIALEAIQLLTEEMPEALIGAGTVKTVHELEQCAKAGARFALSPGSTEALLEAGAEIEIPYIPGVASASELMKGIDSGYRFFKFFPAEAAGGIKALNAMAGPFPEVSFCPTGGISKDNFLDYLRLPNVPCVGGSWVLPDEFIQQNNWPVISDLCLNAVKLAKETYFK